MASRLENKFIDYWRLLGGPELEREYRFDPNRRYRFDFALPDLKVGIEIDGGTWSDSRTGHNWGKGITADCRKRNAAALMGWQVFRFTSDMLTKRNVVDSLEPVIEYVKYIEQEPVP